jgi:hypothetical protein
MIAVHSRPGSAANAPASTTCALRERCETVRRLFIEARNAGCSARYRIGAVVLGIMDDPTKYGTSGVKSLASAVRKNEDTLYMYASVARCWNADEFGALSARVGRHGEPLTFAHFIALAQVPSTERRSALLECALADGLAVRELRRIVAQRAMRDDAPAGRTKLQAALATTLTTVGVLRSLQRIVTELRSSFTANELEAQVTQLLAACERLHGECASARVVLAAQLSDIGLPARHGAASLARRSKGI